MSIEFSKLVDQLQQAAEEVAPQRKADEAEKPLTVLTGANATSKAALLNRAMVI